MTTCPGRDKLAAYENGELSEDQADPLEDHLRHCQACQTVMETARRSSMDAAVLRDVFQQSIGESTLGSWAVEGGAPEGGTADPTRGQTALAGGALLEDTQTAEPGTAKMIFGAPRRDAPALVREGAEAGKEAGPQWVVPDYERIQMCGEGAYGSVWAVRDRVGVYRALKILDMSRMRRAKVGCRESTALETYCRKVGRHPYLIDVYHVGVVGDQLYYTMELADDAGTSAPVRGGEFPVNYRPLTLHAVLRRRRIQVDTAIEIIRRLLRGLSKLHNLDLVHRDVKPANIIFVKHRPKLADIGMIALGAEGNVIIGTPQYMPPDRIMDFTADTFAMGKVLHNMIAGHHPATFPALPSEYRYGSLKWDMNRLNELVVRACSPDAADRYPMGSDMLDDLEACADFPFRTLFDDLNSSSTAPEGRRSRSPKGTVGTVAAQILLAAVRAIPWIVALAIVVIVVAWLK